jgi:hypothetical protein
MLILAKSNAIGHLSSLKFTFLEGKSTNKYIHNSTPDFYSVPRAEPSTVLPLTICKKLHQPDTFSPTVHVNARKLHRKLLLLFFFLEFDASPN